MSPIVPKQEVPSPPSADADTLIVAKEPVSGTKKRLDVPVPFFLQNHVFSSFGEPDYSWNRKETMVIFVENSGFDSARSMKKEMKKESGVDYSIGGCPLECPFDLDEDFDKALVIDFMPTVFSAMNIPPKYLPMTINEGRFVVGQVFSQTQPFVEDMNLVNDSLGWPSNDALVASFVDSSDQQRSLTFTGRGKGYQTFNLHCFGRYRPDSDLLTIASFKKYHQMNMFTFDNRPIGNIAVHSVYEKLHGEYASRGKVYIEFLFKDPANNCIFDTPPPDEAHCKIAIKPLPGDANPSMKSLWEEVEDLERWIKLLATCKSENPDATSLLNSTAYDIPDERVTENVKAVQELLATEPAVDLHGASTAEFSDSLDMVLQRIVQQARADSDFTDKLWFVVRGCKTIDELQECLSLVFKTVANKMYRPYLLLTNTTEMAQKLSRAMKGEITTMLSMRQHSSLVKLIIECGLQKLFKDYNFALAMSHLIERGEIDCFAPTMDDMAKSLSTLKKLHCILEVMCLTKERLVFSVNIQESHVKKMIKRFSESNKELSWDEIYHFDVLLNDVRHILSGLHPFYYKIKMESQTLLKSTTTTVVVSTENYIRHRENPGDEVHSRLYYLYMFGQSKRLGT